MANLKLPHPKLMDKALPANQACGKIETSGHSRLEIAVEAIGEKFISDERDSLKGKSWNHFLLPLLGGVVIGIAASLMLFLNGRVAGVSGIVGGAINAKKGDFLANCVCIGVDFWRSCMALVKTRSLTG